MAHKIKKLPANPGPWFLIQKYVFTINFGKGDKQDLHADCVAGIVYANIVKSQKNNFYSS